MTTNSWDREERSSELTEWGNATSSVVDVLENKYHNSKHCFLMAGKIRGFGRTEFVILSVETDKKSLSASGLQNCDSQIKEASFCLILGNLGNSLSYDLTSFSLSAGDESLMKSLILKSPDS